jgi:hypothetical protein
LMCSIWLQRPKRHGPYSCASTGTCEWAPWPSS